MIGHRVIAHRAPYASTRAARNAGCPRRTRMARVARRRSSMALVGSNALLSADVESIAGRVARASLGASRRSSSGTISAGTDSPLGFALMRPGATRSLISSNPSKYSTVGSTKASKLTRQRKCGRPWSSSSGSDLSSGPPTIVPTAKMPRGSAPCLNMYTRSPIVALFPDIILHHSVASIAFAWNLSIKARSFSIGHPCFGLSVLGLNVSQYAAMSLYVPLPHGFRPGRPIA